MYGPIISQDIQEYIYILTQFLLYVGNFMYILRSNNKVLNHIKCVQTTYLKRFASSR